jgi:hypothetical protein
MNVLPSDWAGGDLADGGCVLLVDVSHHGSQWCHGECTVAANESTLKHVVNWGCETRRRQRLLPDFSLGLCVRRRPRADNLSFSWSTAAVYFFLPP